MNSDTLDLTRGSVPLCLIRFSFPLLLANLLQSFYSMADLLVVGRFVGETGLAAVSSASTLCFLLNAVCMGFSAGGTVLTARARGAGDRLEEEEAAAALLLLALAGSALLTAAALLCYRPLFTLMALPSQAMGDACGYMAILCWGTPFVFGYNAVCAILKGRGDSRGPLRFVAAAAVVNLLLDLILAGPCGLGTAGTAWATVAAQGVSFLLSLAHLHRCVPLSHRRHPHPPPPHHTQHPQGHPPAHHQPGGHRPAALLSLLLLGLPSAVQIAVVNLSYLILTGLLNPFGVSVAAAAGIGLKVSTFAGMPCWALGYGVTAMVGQNLGAGDPDRVRQTVRSGLLLSLGATALLTALVQLAAAPIIALFEPENAAVTAEGVRYLRICCSVNGLIYAAMYVFDSFAIGSGASWVAMCNAMLDAALLRLPLCWLLAFPLALGPAGIYLGQAFSPILPALAGLCYFRLRCRRS